MHPDQGPKVKVTFELPKHLEAIASRVASDHGISVGEYCCIQIIAKLDVLREKYVAGPLVGGVD